MDLWINKKYLPTKFFGNAYEKKDESLEVVPDISTNRKDYEIASWELNPGDLIAFNFSRDKINSPSFPEIKI